MRKNCNRRIAAVLALLLLCLSVTGCGSSDESLVYMNYGTGIDDFGRYNTDLYGVNGLNDPSGPDPGVFYVSEEEDPEYGGYFYRYHTSAMTEIPDTDYYEDNFIRQMMFYCDRSVDLYHWEPAGALAGGYALEIDQFDWCSENYWAPEVIRNPADGKYYMYFSAAAKQDLGIDYMSDATDYTDRLYIGVAVSDTPVGPFDLLGNVDEETGILTPSINFQVGLGIDHNIGAIDAHPFLDDDGQLYLYFVRHGDSHNQVGNQASGMKMLSMTEPDYATATVLTRPGYATIDGFSDILVADPGEEYFADEGSVNEGPFMYKHNGKYYLTYSAYGYGSAGYSVHQAVGDSPLGPFRKLSQEEGNPVLDGSLFGEVQGTGHHSLVEVGDELWIVYHRHSSIIDGLGWDRPTAVDRIVWVVNGNGDEVMTSNGPSRILSWLPEEISGYKNVAATAAVSATNGTGTAYLTDGALNLYDVAKDYALSVSGGDVTVTLRWEQPVSVSSVMIYNAASASSAFSQISDLRFKLAEQPDWASKDYDWAVIENLQLPVQAWDELTEDYLECAPAVAEFDAIMVTEIQFTVKQADRLVAYDEMGQVNTKLQIPEIVVLGGDVTNE